jgi:DNA helicase IV
MVVLIRNPKDAVLSFLVRESGISARFALAYYIRFYAKVRSYRSCFVLADFDEVTTDFGAVIGRINRRFGTAFNLFEHTPENVEKVLQIVKEMDKADQGKTVITETTVALPSKIREQMKQDRYTELINPTNIRLLERAMTAYREMLEMRE